MGPFLNSSQTSTQNLKPNKLQHMGGALLTLGYVVSGTVLGFFLSSSNNSGLWLIGQVILGINIFQWFVLEHDFGHNAFFPNRSLNLIFGFIASCFCLLPFVPWKFIHARHHRWTGWKDLDPTMQQTLNRPSSGKVAFANFLWKYSIPLLTLGFSFGNFWNIKKLFLMTDRKSLRIQFVLSQLLVIIVVISLISFSSWSLRNFAFAYFIFLFISDPLLISQHSHLIDKIASQDRSPQLRPETIQARPFPIEQQDQFTRNLEFSGLISRAGLLNFNRHSHHHHYPTLPCFVLHLDNQKYPHSYPAWSWFKRAKSIPLDQLLFESKQKSELKI